MSSPTAPADFAHSVHAAARRREKATVLARWCYQQGIGHELVELDPQLRRLVARRAGVAPPRDHDGRSETWELTAQLLTQRADWDLRHGVTAPPRSRCVRCTVLGEPCPGCTAETSRPRQTCVSCGYELDPVLPANGLRVHPTCPEPPAQRPLRPEQQESLL